MREKNFLRNPRVRIGSFYSQQRYKPERAVGPFPGFLRQIEWYEPRRWQPYPSRTRRRSSSRRRGWGWISCPRPPGASCFLERWLRLWWRCASWRRTRQWRLSRRWRTPRCLDWAPWLREGGWQSSIRITECLNTFQDVSVRKGRGSRGSGRWSNRQQQLQVQFFTRYM